MANLLTRIGFIDETSVRTNMAKTTGWAPCGVRLVDHAPFGHWHTQTFIAALRHDRLDAPWVINRELFDRYVETRLVPTLQPGDVIILDNLSSHKSPNAARMLKDVGAWFLPLPPCSPDLNPIEMAFAKLKTLLRKTAARTYDDLWSASRVRAATFHRIALSLEKTFSIGLRSGEYGGRNRNFAPATSIACRPAAPLWLPRLSMISMSPGRSVGTRTRST